MPSDWILFIYSLPSQPSRKRAYVWRELKKLGAVNLHHGVAIVPRRPDLEERMVVMSQRVEDEGGSADLIFSPQFADRRAEDLIQGFQEERAAEYRELYHACARFLRDVLEDVDADEFGFPGVSNLESELVRLKRWDEQIRARDYFNAPGSDRVQEMLEKCERAFERFVGTAHERLDAADEMAEEDVFERLAGPAGGDLVAEDHPL
jgi:hypothetical protein